MYQHKVRKKIVVVSSCLAVVAGLLFSMTQAWAYDWEFWPENTIKAKIVKQVFLYFQEEFRIRKEMGQFYEYQMYVGPTINVNRYFDAAVLYKLDEKLTNKKKTDYWADYNFLVMDGTLKYDWKHFQVFNRFRFEYDGTRGRWIYRDRVKFATPFKIFKVKLTPYMYNEFFYDIDPITSGYHENRAQGGIIVDLIFKTQLTTYYMFRSLKKQGDWINANVLGVSLGMNF